MKKYVVAISGASGVQFSVRLMQALAESRAEIHLVISDAARLVFKEEMNIGLSTLPSSEQVKDAFGLEQESSVQVYSAKDFTAPIASGSFPVDGMFVVPCSMGTLGAISSGISQNLIHRAADCMIKESRKLVIVPRETPLSAIHLENMLKLSRLGVKVVPPVPGFYSGEKTLEDMVDFIAGKILDQMEVPHALYPRWVGKRSDQTLPWK